MNFDIENSEDTKENYFYDAQDPQGIKWEHDIPLSRRLFRLRRMREYDSFRNSRIDLEYQDKTLNFMCKFFTFSMNHAMASEFAHFQLRNNVQTFDSEYLYIKIRPNQILKYNPITREREIVSTPNFTAVSYHVYENYLLLGGMDGELMLQDTEKNIKFSKVLCQENSRITNSVKFFRDEGTLNLLAANNDKKIRIIDAETQDEKKVVEFGACVNDASVSHDMKRIGICLDATEDLIIDKNTGEIIHTLQGHTDFGFSVNWDPSNEYLLATGNQDRSIMIWDIRQGSVLSPLEVLFANLGSTLNVQYSKNGKYLAFSESADFMNILDKRCLVERQTLDYFGEISGFCFCEDYRNDMRIFIGMGDSGYGSLIEVRENGSQEIYL